MTLPAVPDWEGQVWVSFPVRHLGFGRRNPEEPEPLSEPSRHGSGLPATGREAC